jgi:hypothetical protein
VLADGALLYDPEREQVHHLNETAARIWEVFAHGGTADDAADALCDRYEVSPERARADVAAVQAAWSTEGLLAP